MALERMTLVRCTERKTGASLFKDRCVLKTVVIVSVGCQDPAQMRLATDDCGVMPRANRNDTQNVFCNEWTVCS
jgi:hypothetical protein